MKDIGRRIYEYLEYKSLKIGDFEESIGVSQGYISKIMQKGGRGIRSDTLSAIILKYNDINLYWLLLGEGDMILKESSNTVVHTLKEEELKEIITYYRRLVRDLQLAMEKFGDKT